MQEISVIFDIFVASVSRIPSGDRLAAVTGYALYRTLGELMTPSVIKATR